MYLMKVLLFQQPISCVVLTGTPAKNMVMMGAAPDLIECVPTRSALYPSLLPPISATARRSFGRTVFDVIPPSLARLLRGTR